MATHHQDLIPDFATLSKTKTVLIMHYGISIVTLKNLWSELVGY